MPALAGIHKTLRAVKDVPTLPDVYRRVSELVSSGKASSEKLEAVIETDAALTGKLLRLVNSAFFSLSGEISTVRRAVSMLGFETLEQLVLTTSVMNLFSGPAGAVLDPQAVWKHSLATAVGARYVGSMAALTKSEELFVAGLLHDIGILYEMRYHREELEDAVTAAREDGRGLLAAEARIFGQSHDVTGAMLLRHWKLPPRIVTAVADHHRPHRAVAFAREAAAISVAENLARVLGHGDDGEGQLASISASTWTELGLDEPALDRVADAIDRAMARFEGFLTRERPGAKRGD